MYVMCFTHILIEIDLKPYKHHKKQPTFSKTQNFQYPLRVIESKIKQILRAKYVNSLIKKGFDYMAHSM